MVPRQSPCSNGKHRPQSLRSGCNNSNKGSFNPPADADLVGEDAAGDAATQAYPFNRARTCSRAQTKEVAANATCSSYNTQEICLGGFQRKRAQPHQQQHQQRTQPQHQQQYQGNHQGGNAQQHMQFGNAHPLPTNNSYCWTHGYVVSSQHNSMSCMNCAPGH